MPIWQQSTTQRLKYNRDANTNRCLCRRLHFSQKIQDDDHKWTPACLAAFGNCISIAVTHVKLQRNLSCGRTADKRTEEKRRRKKNWTNKKKKNKKEEEVERYCRLIVLLMLWYWNFRNNSAMLIPGSIAQCLRLDFSPSMYLYNGSRTGNSTIWGTEYYYKF